MNDRDRFLALVDELEQVLISEARHRDRPGWVERERRALANAANAWAVAHGPLRTVTVDEIEQVEPRAMGHSDYARKLALYIAELVYEAE